MNCPNNLLSVIFNGAQIESDLSTMRHCSRAGRPGSSRMRALIRERADLREGAN